MKLVFKLALGAAVVATAGVAVPVVTAGAAGAGATTKPLCRVRDVSYYYGGAFEGLGRRHFDITLLAHDGTDCRLSDTPLLTLQDPNGKAVKISTLGRGGTLRLTPGSPLHTTISYAIPQDEKDDQKVSTLTLTMPGGGFVNPQPFGAAYGAEGLQDTSKIVGIGVLAWTTGLGAGQGEDSE